MVNRSQSEHGSLSHLKKYYEEIQKDKQEDIHEGGSENHIPKTYNDSEDSKKLARSRSER